MIKDRGANPFPELSLGASESNLKTLLPDYRNIITKDLSKLILSRKPQRQKKEWRPDSR